MGIRKFDKPMLIFTAAFGHFFCAALAAMLAIGSKCYMSKFPTTIMQVQGYSSGGKDISQQAYYDEYLFQLQNILKKQRYL
jgi:hypothetical protein